MATDVASRGLDFPKVSYVVNYDLPTNIEDYVHRIGRTGRCGNSGISISFVNQTNRPILKNLYQFMKDNGQDIPEWFEKMYTSGYSGVASKNDDNKFLQKKRGPEQPFLPFFNNSQMSMMRNPQQGFGFNYSNPNINNTQQGFQPRVNPQEERKQDFGKYDFFQDHFNTDRNRPSNFDDKPRNDYRDIARPRDSDKYKPGGFDDYRSRVDNAYRNDHRPNNTYDRHRDMNDRRDSDRDHRHNDSRSQSDKSKHHERRRDDSRDRDYRHRRDDREYDRHRDSRDSGSRHSSRSHRDDRDERRYDDKDRRDERRYDDRDRKEESRNDWRSGYFSSKYPDSVSLKKPRFDN